jgi:putative ATP-binding cassette transporter
MEKAKSDVKHSKVLFKRSDKSINFKNLSLEKPNHIPLLNKVSFSVKEGERVLIIGGSGSGKSTLVRALRGLWTYGSGKIELPQNIFYVPQRPYMPIATLKEAMLYPALSSEMKGNDKKLSELLDFFGLGYLFKHLDECKDWSTILSLGEQQRVSFIRILINKPKWIVMDEPTSSLNKLLEELAFEKMIKEIKDVTVVTVGHSDTLKKFHKKVVDIEKWASK